MNNYQRPYYPRRPVKSFQDLEVYQKLLAVSVAVAKRLDLSVIARNEVTKQSDIEIATPRRHVGTRNDITVKLTTLALGLPLKIAAAHSIRFSDQLQAIAKLEEVMLDCNILIVYLEQYRDIENKDIETEFFEEQIKNILATRMKVMHLQMSWKKFSSLRGVPATRQSEPVARSPRSPEATSR